MFAAADLDFMQLAIYAAVLIAGLLGALFQKRERDRPERGGKRPAPQRGRPMPGSERAEPEEEIIILPPEDRPVPPLPPAPPKPAPPRRERPQEPTARPARRATPETAPLPRAQPVGELEAPRRTVSRRTAPTAAGDRRTLRGTPAPPPEAASDEEARPSGPRRTAIPVAGLVRALLARRDGAAAALVASEILAPPVSLRENDPTRVV